MSRILIPSLLAIGLSLAGMARAETIERFDAGFWQGGAQTGEDGALFDCYLRAENLRDKYSIFLRYDTDGVHISLYDTKWALPAGDSFKGRVRIDRRFDAELPGEVMGAGLVDYLFGFDEAGWEAVMSGRRITLEGPQGNIQFPLTGTRLAMEALLRCADKYYADGGAAAPAVAVAEPDTEPQEPAAAAAAPEADTADAGALIARALKIAAGQDAGTPAEAFAAADRAAQLGDRRGHWLTGRFALAGYGTGMSRDTALARILLAAEAGHPEAQTFLAFEYLQSDDPVQQIVGRDYLQKAAAQAHAPALAALRLMQAGDAR